MLFVGFNSCVSITVAALSSCGRFELFYTMLGGSINNLFVDIKSYLNLQIGYNVCSRGKSIVFVSRS